MSDLESLAARVAVLETREVVRALCAAYARGCDTNDAVAVAALFEPEGILTIPSGSISGRAAIQAWYAERLVEPTKHHVVNTTFAAVPGEADLIDARSEFVSTHQYPAGPGAVWGAYVDRVRVRDGHAAFVSRSILIDGRADLCPSGTNQARQQEATT